MKWHELELQHWSVKNTNIRIFDTTLRDGEQSPGVSLSPEKKLNIAKKLDELGVDAIETGFPVISDGERELSLIHI